MARDLGRLGKEPEVQHYEHDPGRLKAGKGVSLLIQVQRNAALQNMPREGKDQGGEPSSRSRRGRLSLAADDRKATLQPIKTWQAREELEEKRAAKPIMPDLITCLFC